METTQILLSNEQFSKLQVTIIAAQMLPYFFDDKRNFTYKENDLKTPYDKTAYVSMMMVHKINDVIESLDDDAIRI